MKIFLSWAKGDSEKVASLLRQYFGLVFENVGLFFSQVDIKSGPWAISLANALKECDFGIFCVTRENLESPWMHFEAGAIAGGESIGKTISFFLIGVEHHELRGPYSGYQQKKFDRDGIRSVMTEIYEKLGSPFSQDLFNIKFEAFMNSISNTKQWAEIQSIINAPPKGDDEAQLDKIIRDIKDLLDRKLNTKYLGMFPGFFKDICDCAATATDELYVCCDYATYGQFTSPKLFATDFASFVDGSNIRVDSTGMIRAYDLYREIIKQKFNRNKKSVNVVVYNDHMRRSNNREQVLADVEKSKDRWKERTGSAVDSAEQLLKLLDESQKQKREAHFGFLGNQMVYTGTQMPIYAWVADQNRAVFAIPDTTDNSVEHGFETTDKKLISAIKSVILRYMAVPSAPVDDQPTSPRKPKRGS